MTDFALMRDANGLDRAERMFVECNRFAGAADGQIGYCSFVPLGYWFDWCAHLSSP